MKLNLLITVIIVGFCLISVSCKKDRLNNRHGNLVGKWEWTHTCEQIRLDGYNLKWDTIYPKKDNYFLEFQKKGILLLYKNDEIIDEILLKKDIRKTDEKYNVYGFKQTYNSVKVEFFHQDFSNQLHNSWMFPYCNDSTQPNGNIFTTYYFNYFKKIN
jgi:hypothetical protein